MTDGMIGSSHVTIPDLLEPVVGFRAFDIRMSGGTPAQPARGAIPAWEEKVWTGNPHAQPFIPPNAKVTCPVTGRLIPNYTILAEAFERWQKSLGEFKTIHHAAIPAIEAVPAVPPLGYELHSPNVMGHKWTKGVNKARCKKSKLPLGLRDSLFSEHTAPDPDCQCGLYSYYEPSVAKIQSAIMANNYAVGIVTQWGRIEAHSTGMRSEFMKVEALLGGELAKKICNEWDIPFVPTTASASKFVAISKEFGSPLPESMRPKAATPVRYAPLERRERSRLRRFIGSKYYWGAIVTVEVVNLVLGVGFNLY